MDKEYRTVSREVSIEYEEKKSRFIAAVRPVTEEEQALGFINGLKSKYWDATHNVYAYYIGGESTFQRYSDDGEPSGTAGLPTLEAIKKANIRDVAVVVTRYFGGTLLGAAGLVRAYGKSASLGIEAAGIIRRQLCSRVRIILEYDLLGKVQSMISAEGYHTADTIYGSDVDIIVHIPVDEYDGFVLKIIEATSARALIDKGETEYVTLPV
ncbi:MAG: YigZ family protein [Clostridiales bacterium]|nr:YigZ family protein [Clostridiales bacterium]